MSAAKKFEEQCDANIALLDEEEAIKKVARRAHGLSKVAALGVASGSAPIARATEPKRRITTVDKDGNPVRVIDEVEVAKAVTKRLEVEIAVVDGKRPRTILCADCKKPLPVPQNGGTWSKLCRSCKGSMCDACETPLAQGKPGRFCKPCALEEAHRKHLLAITCQRCKGKKAAAALICMSCVKAKTIERRGEPKCVDCGATLNAIKQRARRCRRCACIKRESDVTPEDRARRSQLARNQMSREERIAIARAGGIASAAKCADMGARMGKMQRAARESRACKREAAKKPEQKPNTGEGT